MTVREVFNLIRSGNFEEAEPKLELIEDHHDRNSMVSFIHFLKGDLDTAFSLIEENINEILTTNTSPVCSTRTLSFYAFYLAMTGKNEDALAVIEYAKTILPKIEEIAGEWEFNQLAGDLLNVEGIIYNQLGKSETSIKKYQRSLKYREKNKSEFDIAIVKSNLALIYLDRGDISSSLKNIREAIWIFKDLGLKQPLGNAYSTIGHLLTQSHDFASAKYYLERSIEIFSELNNPLNLAEAYYRLITLYVNKDMTNEARLILKEMRMATKGVLLKSVNVYIKLSEAILLKSQRRLVSKARALEILQSLKSIKTEDSSLYIEILFHIADVLLFELAITFDENLISELNETLMDISDLANKLKSQAIIVRSLIIQAKLFILMNNKGEAEIILRAAYKIAEAMDSKELLNQINLIRDDQTILLEKWRALGESYKTFDVVKEEDIKSEIMINMNRIQSLLKKNQYLQLEQDDFANIDRLRRIINNESLLHSVVYKVSEFGTDIIWLDIDESTFSDDFHVDTFLTQLGIVLSVIFGQGDQYHSGLFNLPAGKLKDYRVLAYVFRIRDRSAFDDRMDLAYAFFCIFIPSVIADYLPPLTTLEREFESIIQNYSELSTIEFEKVKHSIIFNIKEWINSLAQN